MVEDAGIGRRTDPEPVRLQDADNSPWSRTPGSADALQVSREGRHMRRLAVVEDAGIGRRYGRQFVGYIDDFPRRGRGRRDRQTLVGVRVVQLDLLLLAVVEDAGIGRRDVQNFRIADGKVLAAAEDAGIGRRKVKS